MKGCSPPSWAEFDAVLAASFENTIAFSEESCSSLRLDNNRH